MTEKTINGVTTTYTTNAANEVTNSGFAYDANGNQTAAPAMSFSYNAKDQTTAINSSSYNYTGPTQAGIINLAGTAIRHARLGISASGSDYYTRDDDGDLISLRHAGTRYYYLFDAIGSVIGVTDASGNLVATYTYEPYGKLVSSTGTLSNPWRFAGLYYDTATGTYKADLRYYDPATGRWMQRDIFDDPLDEHGWNQYLYAGDDPVNLSDPSGACWAGLCWHHIVGAATMLGGAILAVGGVTAGGACLAVTRGIDAVHCVVIAGYGVSLGGAAMATGYYVFRGKHRKHHHRRHRR